MLNETEKEAPSPPLAMLHTCHVTHLVINLFASRFFSYSQKLFYAVNNIIHVYKNNNKSAWYGTFIHPNSSQKDYGS